MGNTFYLAASVVFKIYLNRFRICRSQRHTAGQGGVLWERERLGQGQEKGAVLRGQEGPGVSGRRHHRLRWRPPYRR